MVFLVKARETKLPKGSVLLMLRSLLEVTISLSWLTLGVTEFLVGVLDSGGGSMGIWTKPSSVLLLFLLCCLEANLDLNSFFTSKYSSSAFLGSYKAVLLGVGVGDMWVRYCQLMALETV